jgi:hypothetical protein
MPKLGLAILTVMFASSFEFSQAAAAAQSQARITRSTIDNSSFAKDLHSIVLVSSRCKIRRYRRPH